VSSESELPDPNLIRDLMPFAVLIGVELLDARPELVRGMLAFSDQRCTAGGVMHGGALMALADTCGGVCAALNLPEGATGTATIESKTNFMRALRDGVVSATSRPLHVGRTIIVLETELTRHDGALIAKTTQTQAFHRPTQWESTRADG
jgi:1,4-dihydroxy-2-naphthoyl-CoA hydrolase